MRKANKEEVSRISVANFLHIDFHRFMEKELLENDIELSKDLGLSLREVRLLKKKLR